MSTLEKVCSVHLTSVVFLLFNSLTHKHTFSEQILTTIDMMRINIVILKCQKPAPLSWKQKPTTNRLGVPEQDTMSKIVCIMN